MTQDISLLPLDWLSLLLVIASIILAAIGIMIGVAGWRMNNDDDFDLGPF